MRHSDLGRRPAGGGESQKGVGSPGRGGLRWVWKVFRAERYNDKSGYYRLYYPGI